MPSTSVYLPDDLLDALDRLAADEGVPRNRLIVDALREALARKRRRWQSGYFSGEHLSPEDVEELRSGAVEFDRSLREGRRSRRRPPF